MRDHAANLTVTQDVFAWHQSQIVSGTTPRRSAASLAVSNLCILVFVYEAALG